MWRVKVTVVTGALKDWELWISIFSVIYIQRLYWQSLGKPWTLLMSLYSKLTLKTNLYGPICFTGHTNLAPCHKLWRGELWQAYLHQPAEHKQKWLISLFSPLSVSLFIYLLSQQQHDISSFASVLPPHVQSLLPSSRSMVEIWHVSYIHQKFLYNVLYSWIGRWFTAAGRWICLETNTDTGRYVIWRQGCFFYKHSLYNYRKSMLTWENISSKNLCNTF